MPISCATWKRRWIVAESALAALSVRQRAHLRALGLEPLSLRPSPIAAAIERGSNAPRSATPRLHLSRRDGGVVSRSDARVVAVLRALGATPDDVVDTACTGIPSLSLPTPSELGSAQAKRALWPDLRRLRRLLISPDADR